MRSRSFLALAVSSNTWNPPREEECGDAVAMDVAALATAQKAFLTTPWTSIMGVEGRSFSLGRDAAAGVGAAAGGAFSSRLPPR